MSASPNRSLRAASKVILLAGLGTVLSLGATSDASAQGKLCPVDFSVTSTEALGALQITADYDAIAALGDIVECVVAQTGATDTLVNAAGNSATMGYADASGFTGPDLFATCYFKVTNDADPAPVAGNFAVTIDDAANTDVPPTSENPTIGVAVGACVPSGSCSFTPETGCKVSTTAGKSKVFFKDDVANPASDVKDQGQFQWKSGALTVIGEFGTPLDAGETYSWCVYDDGELIRGSDVPAAGTCGAVPCWKATGTTGFQFKGDVEGIAQIKLKAGEAGKAQVSVKAKSKAGNFSSPALSLGSGVVSQLVIDDGIGITCFQTTAGVATVDTTSQYKAAGNP